MMRTSIVITNVISVSAASTMTGNYVYIFTCLSPVSIQPNPAAGSHFSPNLREKKNWWSWTIWGWGSASCPPLPLWNSVNAGDMAKQQTKMRSGAMLQDEEHVTAAAAVHSTRCLSPASVQHVKNMLSATNSKESCDRIFARVRSLSSSVKLSRLNNN